MKQKNIIIIVLTTFLIATVSIATIQEPTIQGQTIHKQEKDEKANESTQKKESNKRNTDEETSITPSTKNPERVKAERLIATTLNLRTASKKNAIINISQHYTRLDKELSHTSKEAAWEQVADCAYERCPNETYLALLERLSQKNLEKIHSLIRTYQLCMGREKSGILTTHDRNK